MCRENVRITIYYPLISPALLLAAVWVMIACSHCRQAFADSKVAEPNARPLTHEAGLVLLREYCSDCHDSGAAEGNFDLSQLGRPEDLIVQHRLTKRVLAQIEAGAMPPEDPKPTAQQKRELVNWLGHSLENADWEALSDPSEIALPRLTRAEYRNTIRDLLGVDVDFTDVLPDDPIGTSGFANDRGSLLMTGGQLTSYLNAAQLVVDAVSNATLEPNGLHFEAEQMKRSTIQGTRPIKTLEDGTAGFEFQQHRGIKYQQISRTIDFPRPGTYRINIRAKTTRAGLKGGLWIALDSIGDLKRDATVVVESKSLEVYESTLFVPAGHHELIVGYDFDGVPWLPPIPERPQRKMPFNRDRVIDRTFKSLGVTPVTWDEIQQLEGFREPADKQAAQMLVDEVNRILLDESIRTYELYRLYTEHHFLPVNNPRGFTGPAEKDQQRLAEMTGVTELALRQLWKSHEPSRHRRNIESADDLRARWEKLKADRSQHVGNVFVDWVEVSGPIQVDSEFVRRFASHGDDDPGDHRAVKRTRKLLAWLLPRAFRRTVPDKELASFQQFYESERLQKVGHREALKRTLVAVLVSPSFLYRAEPASQLDEIVELTGEQLAARMSYFLWSAPPDEELRRVATLGQLRDPQVLAAQIERLMMDPRSTELCRDFTVQWLGLSSLGREKVPDSELFREFSWHLAEDMRDEVAMAFRQLLVDDIGLLKLLDSDDTFLNERLARLYGVKDVEGPHLRRVTLTDQRRGGLLGTAAVLTATSLPARTSPVQRGKFVLETLLGEELPPPPEDAGTLDDDAGQRLKRSLREELAAHRSQPSCIGCHERIDPLGFSLENFDFVGRWRQETPGGVVDASASLPDGTELNGVVQLKQYLVEHQSEAFARNVTRRLLAYALGRPLDYFDEAEVHRILTQLALDGYSARRLIHEIIQSRPFRYQHPRQSESN